MLHSTVISEEKAFEYLNETKGNVVPIFSPQQTEIIRDHLNSLFEIYRRKSKSESLSLLLSNELFLPYSSYHNPEIHRLQKLRETAYYEQRPNANRNEDDVFMSPRTIQRFSDGTENTKHVFVAAIRDYLILVGVLDYRLLSESEKIFAPALALDATIPVRSEFPDVFFNDEPVTFQAFEKHKNRWVSITVVAEHISGSIFRFSEKYEYIEQRCIIKNIEYWIFSASGTFFGFSFFNPNTAACRYDLFQNHGVVRSPALFNELSIQRTYLKDTTPLVKIEEVSIDNDKLVKRSRHGAGASAFILLKNITKNSKIENHKYFPYTVYYDGADPKRRDTKYYNKHIELMKPSIEEFFHLIRERYDESLRSNFNYPDNEQKIREALDAGFDVNTPDPQNGARAIHHAATFCDEALTAILDEQPDIDYLVRMKDGYFPLDLAQRHQTRDADIKNYIAHVRTKSFDQAATRGILDEFAYYGHDNRDNAFPVWAPDDNTP